MNDLRFYPVEITDYINEFSITNRLHVTTKDTYLTEFEFKEAMCYSHWHQFELNLNRLELSFIDSLIEYYFDPHCMNELKFLLSTLKNIEFELNRWINIFPIPLINYSKEIYYNDSIYKDKVDNINKIIYDSLFNSVSRIISLLDNYIEIIGHIPIKEDNEYETIEVSGNFTTKISFVYSFLHKKKIIDCKKSDFNLAFSNININKQLRIKWLYELDDLAFLFYLLIINDLIINNHINKKIRFNALIVDRNNKNYSSFHVSVSKINKQFKNPSVELKNNQRIIFEGLNKIFNNNLHYLKV